MIQTIDNPILLPQILKLAENVKDIPLKALERMLSEGIKSPDTKIIIDKKDEEVRGFMFASIEEFRGEDVVFIQTCSVKPEFPNIGTELLRHLRHWAQKKNIQRLIIITSRNPQAFVKKYGFKLISHVLNREV